MSKNQNKGFFKTIQDFLTSYDGKMVLNFAYSWGAAIVILGALFKLTHLPGANLMLYLGMGTEVLVFLVSAFDRPAKTYRWESVFPNLEITGKGPKKEEDEDYEGVDEALLSAENTGIPGISSPGAVPGGSPSVVYMGGGGNGTGPEGAGDAIPSPAVSTAHAGMGTTVIGGGFMAGSSEPVPTIPTEELEEATQSYLDKLKEMTETIGRMNEQMANFVCNPEQMEGVNRHIAGLNAIFELQLRSASRQVESVDKVHEQTEKMAAQIEELNKVYERMLHAMTANVISQQSVTPNK